MKTDNRYKITREYCGHCEPHYVVRFCGSWVGHSANKSDAVNIRQSHKAIQTIQNNQGENR